MTRKMSGVMLGLSLFAAVMLAADAVYGGGVAVGIGFGGGGGVHGGVGYGGGGYHGGGYGGYGGYYGGSGVRWGVNVPLSSDGSVRLGVGNGGYYAPNYYYRYNDYPYRGGYYGGYYNYQGGSYDYAQPSGTEYTEYAPQAPAEPPPPPTAGQVGRMSDEQLAGLLRMASEGYSRELDDYKNGETWQKYFKLAEMIEILETKSNPPDAVSRTTLAEVLTRMDSTAKNPAYETIAKSWGFKALQVGLREYTLPPKERTGHSLTANLQKIAASLDGVTTGEGWKKHLQIEDLGKLADSANMDDASLSKRLEKILAKFDAVAQNFQYRAIAELDGFAATRAGLQRYINALQADQSSPPPPPPPAAETVQDF